MNITNRLFTYPILSEEKDDFLNSIFAVDYKYEMNGVNDLKLSFDIAMNCPEIDEMIVNGQAEYVIHMECSSTAYRTVSSSITKHIDVSLPIKRINGSFDVVAFIVLKKDIKNYSCADWNLDFEGMSFDLSVGSILAYKNLPGLEVTKDFEEFKNASSIFTIYKRLTDEIKPAEIYLDSHSIRIGLCSKDYDAYALYSQTANIQIIFNAMIIFPALVYVFEELQQEGGVETYHGRKWYIALKKAYEKRGVDLVNEINNPDKSSFILAQEAMELPISESIASIPQLFDVSEEE